MVVALARSLGSLLFASFLTLMAVLPAEAGGPTPIATDAHHVAILGYDTVSYFTDGKPMMGTKDYAYDWDGATWWFASAAHRDLFAADPDRYMPQFGGFCAGAMTHGVLVPANPLTWAIVDGKLYMTADNDISGWKADAAAGIQKANENWPAAEKNWAAQNQ